MTETSLPPGATTPALRRCAWCTGDPLYQEYHDAEWGRRLSGDDAVFERLALEGFQAGLSWITVLRKRPRFREVFDGFSIESVAAFDESRIQRLLADPGIIRNRAKILATVGNAQAALRIEGGLSDFVLSYAPDPVGARSDQPRTTSAEATALSGALKKRGFRFVGPTTVYAAFQAMGIVDDHDPECFLAGGSASAQ